MYVCSDKSEALTAAQQELAAENHNLIYFFAKVYDLDFDEYYDLLAIGLCRAAKLFDPSHGAKFSTLAFKCMRNEYYRFGRKEKVARRIPKDKIVYYNDAITDGADPLTLLDTLPNTSDSSYAFDPTEAEVQEFLRTVPMHYRVPLIKLMNGKTAETVAREVGCSKQNVSRMRGVFQKYWNSYAIKR